MFGPDGKLYFNVGNEGKQLQHPDGRQVVDLAGNEVITKGKPIAKVSPSDATPDGSQLETVGWNFRNNYELCVDSFGTIWQSDNDDDGNRGVRINYVMEFGNYGYTDEITGVPGRKPGRRPSAKGFRIRSDPPTTGICPIQASYPISCKPATAPPPVSPSTKATCCPKIFRNQIIHCDAGPRVVRAYPVEKQGAGYQAKRSTY